MMMSSTYLQAKEIQGIAGRYLCEAPEAEFTDVKVWTEMQVLLTQGLEDLVHRRCVVPEEEGEAVLAILMGYSVAVRNREHVRKAVQRGKRVLPLLEDEVLKCHLAVFCYGECYDEQLAELAHGLLEELRYSSRWEEVVAVEKLLESMEENKRYCVVG